MLTLRQFLYRKVYLKTAYWKWIRGIVGKRAGWWCQVRNCNASGHHLDCHHMTYKIKWFEWLFPWLMVYLCREHHRRVHNGESFILRGGRRLRAYRKKGTK